MLDVLLAAVCCCGCCLQVSDLQRFVKQLVLVQHPQQAAAAAGSSASGSIVVAGNVQRAPSLAAALGVGPQQ